MTVSNSNKRRSMIMMVSQRRPRGSSLTIAYTLQLLFTVLSVLPHACFSQEAPMIGATKFNNSTSYRTNVCERQQLLYNDTIKLRDALRGLNLSVYITDSTHYADADFFALTENGTIPQNTGELGLTAVILDELAERAGFSWRNRFGTGTGVNEADDGNKTWTDLLIWATETYDIGADIWGRSSARKARGVSFVENYYDNSIILVTKVKKSSSDSNRLWSFLRPFSNWVWISIGISIFVTGFLYTFLEWLDNDADQRHLENKPLATTFLTAMTFTGHFQFQPNTHAARLLTFSWSFWALITASAYTANLASFMVSRNTPAYIATSIEDIIRKGDIVRNGEIVRKGKSICIWGDAVHDDFLRKNYPTFSKSDKVVRKRGLFSVMEGLKNDDCDVAVTGKTYFDTSKNNEYLNKDCTFTWVGEYVQSIPAGMATAIDTGTYCTSLISYVLDLHMNEMKIEGGSGGKSVYEKIMNSYSMKRENVTDHEMCNKPESEINQINTVFEDDSTSLSMKDTGGIFLFHAIASIASVCLALGQYILNRRNGNIEQQGLVGVASRQGGQSIWAPRDSRASLDRCCTAGTLLTHVDAARQENMISSASDSEENRQRDKEGALPSKISQDPKPRQTLENNSLDEDEDDSLLSFDDFDMPDKKD